MRLKRFQLWLALLLSGASFLTLLLISLLTNPIDNVSYAIVFFIVLWFFLVALSYLLILARFKRVKPAARRKILIIPTLLVILLMFRSAGTLSWVDGLVLLVLAVGLLFYSARRP